MKSKAIFILLLSILCVTGMQAFQTEDQAEQQGEAQEIVTLPPMNLDYYTLKMLREGKWQDALDKLFKVYSGGTSDHNLKYYIAYCYENMGIDKFKEKNYQQAIQLFQKALQYVDQWPHLYEHIGLIHYTLSRFQEAEEFYSKALQLDPNRFEALVMLGKLSYDNNRNFEALEHWQAALKIKPDDESLKKKVQELTQLNRMSADMETEKDMLFAVSFDGAEQPQLRDLVVKMLSNITDRIGQELQLYPRRQVPVILLTGRQFSDITDSPKWAGGIYEGHIKIPVDNFDPEKLKIVLAHEYVHAVIFDRLSYRCPWWLHEGLAQYFSGDTERNQERLKIAAKYLGEGKVPDLKTLAKKMVKNADTESVQLAYALALSAVNFYIENYGTGDLRYAIDLMAEGKTFDSIITTITGYSYDEFLANWKETTTYR